MKTTPIAIILSILFGFASVIAAPKGNSLFKAIVDGDVQKVKFIVSKNKAAANSRCKITDALDECNLGTDNGFYGDFQGNTAYYTALHTAIVKENIEIIKVLLDAGADPKATSNDLTVCSYYEAGEDLFTPCNANSLDYITYVQELNNHESYMYDSDDLTSHNETRESIRKKAEIVSLLVKQGAKTEQRHLEYFIANDSLPDDQTKDLVKTFIDAGFKNFYAYVRPFLDHDQDRWRGKPFCLVNIAREHNKFSSAELLLSKGAPDIKSTKEMLYGEKCIEMTYDEDSEEENCCQVPFGTTKVFFENKPPQTFEWKLSFVGYCVD